MVRDGDGVEWWGGGGRDARAIDDAVGSRSARAASGAARHAGQAAHKAGRRFGPRSRALYEVYAVGQKRCRT